ncbi:hypothetical protein ACFL6Y_05180 [Elusimicrobiota bacterium]
MNKKAIFSVTIVCALTALCVIPASLDADYGSCLSTCVKGIHTDEGGSPDVWQKCREECRKQESSAQNNQCDVINSEEMSALFPSDSRAFTEYIDNCAPLNEKGDCEDYALCVKQAVHARMLEMRGKGWLTNKQIKLHILKKFPDQSFKVLAIDMNAEKFISTLGPRANRDEGSDKPFEVIDCTYSASKSKWKIFLPCSIEEHAMGTYKKDELLDLDVQLKCMGDYLGIWKKGYHPDRDCTAEQDPRFGPVRKK